MGMFSDSSTWVYINTGFAVSVLGHYTRDKRHTKEKQLMSKSVDKNCI